MKTAFLSLILWVAGALVCGNAIGGQVGLPVEKIALPAVQGSYLVCIWDDGAGQWLTAHENYDKTGSYSFQLPEWNRWYWIGLWDQANGQYVFGKWVGHFLTN